jgi:Fe-S cluster assembly iron-binding protein IscA
MKSILKCLMTQHHIDHPIAFVAAYLDLLSTKRLAMRERGACSLREVVHTWYKYRKRLALKQKGCYNMSMTLKFTHIGDDEAFDDLEATTEDSGKRVYKTPSGISYPSVTTVVGFKKRAFFAEWRRNNPENLDESFPEATVCTQRSRIT